MAVQEALFPDPEDLYRDSVTDRYNRFTLKGLVEDATGLDSISLEDIFIKVSVEQEVHDESDEKSIGDEENAQRPPTDQDSNHSTPNPQQRDPNSSTNKEVDEQRRTRRRPLTKRETLTVAGALEQHRHLVVLGGPGTGKSTLVRWLAVKYTARRQGEPDALGQAFGEDLLPIVLEMGRFASLFPENSLTDLAIDSQPDLASKIVQYVTHDPWFKGTTSELIATALETGRCMVLLDGLDDIADVTVRRRVVESIDAFAQPKQYGQNRILLTSRPHGYSELTLQGFGECSINALTPAEAAALIRRWYAHSKDSGAQDQAERLVQAMSDNPRVLELTRTPLLCAIIAVVFRASGGEHLPDRRVELYRQCCRALMYAWPRQHKDNPSNEGVWESEMALLEPLAYWLHSEHATAAPWAELQKEVEKILAVKRQLEPTTYSSMQAGQLLEQWCNQDGMLLLRGSGELEFLHRTFQEYFAARFIGSNPDPKYVDLVIQHLHEDWWHEVHLLAIGHLGSRFATAEKASHLLLNILDAVRSPNRILCPYFSESMLLEKARRDVARICARWQWQRRLSWALQRELELAVSGLNDCAPEGVTPNVRDKLADTTATVVIRILNDPGYGARDQMHVFATAVADSPAATQRVQEAITTSINSANYRVRHTAVQLLGHLGGATPELLSALIVLLDDEDDESLRAIMEIFFRRRQPDAEVLVALDKIAASQDWRKQKITVAAADALQQLKHPQPNVPRTHPSTVVNEGVPFAPAAASAALSRLSHPDWVVRRGAISTLTTLGLSTDDIHAAITRAIYDANPLVRHAAIEAAGHLGQASPQMLSALIATLQPSQGHHEKHIGMVYDGKGGMFNYYELGDFEYISDSIRCSSAQALGSLGQATPEVTAALLAALRSTDSWRLPQVAAEALGHLVNPQPEVLTALAESLHHSDYYYLRVASAKALGRLGKSTPEVLVALSHTLQASDSRYYVEQTVAAIEALGQIGDSTSEVRQALLSALQHRDPDVRVKIVEALGRLNLRAPEVVSALVDALRDTDWLVRRTAGRALGNVSTADPANFPRVLRNVYRNLYDIDDGVRKDTVDTLHSLTRGQPLPGFRWPPWRIRIQRRLGYARLLIVGISMLLLAVVLSYVPDQLPIVKRTIRVLEIIGVALTIAAALAELSGYSIRDLRRNRQSAN